MLVKFKAMTFIKNKYPIGILVIISILVILSLLKILVNSKKLELFANDDDIIYNPNLFDNPAYEKNRTLLYGSLFLDNLNKQIKELTEPSINYDTKRIEIIRYSDILL